jgi:2-succinyl-6-hydroxy-2,4-cyclohexadiene-1-carboxylate synthase
MLDLEQIPLEDFADGVAARTRRGPGEVILWIHGYTIDSTSWEEIWSQLPGWTHVGIDLPGHGGSAAAGPEATLREFGETLAEAAMRRNIRHVVGLSLGSMIALQLVLARPTAFASLTMAAPALAGGPVESAVGLRFMELRDTFRRRGRGPWMTELWMRSPPETFAHAPSSLHQRLASLIDRHSWTEFDHARFGIAGFAYQSQDAGKLAQSTARLLILIGEKELEAFRKTAAILSAIRPDAKVVELAGAGHLCLLQAPEHAARLMTRHWQSAQEGSRFSHGSNSEKD